MNDFRNYAVKHHGIASLHVDKYVSAVNDYLTPYIIEERPMNITQLDVFSRLMKDRIIFLGVPIDDDVANIVRKLLPLSIVDVLALEELDYLIGHRN